MEPEKPPKFKILSEEVRQLAPRAGADASEENPYWAEPEPHPNPELGCIRRGICCKSSPGWFGPGEVEKAALVKGMSPDEFVREFLIVDSVEVDGEPVHAFAPVKLDRFGKPQAEPGSRVDGTYRYFRGACIFYTGEGCGIYQARPVECRAYVCTQLPEENLSHQEIGRMWKQGEVWERPKGPPGDIPPPKPEPAGEAAD